MIASWMIAATLLGLIASLAAMAMERALRLLGRQARFGWVFALAITVIWPPLAPALLRPAAASASVSVVSTAPIAGAAVTPATASRTTSFVSVARETLARLDAPLVVLWGTATLLLLVRAGFAVRALRRLAHRAERRTIDGQPVLVSASVGPAAFGIVEPRIVLPSWSLDLDPAMRAIVLRHEQEHLAARDPAMLTLAWVGAALMPWNVALWVIARRLRVAAELDCDHRVVRQGTDARHYARLLLLMVQRQTSTAFAALMAGSPTTLHQRISAMHAAPPSRPKLRVAGLTVLALVAGAVASSPALAGELAAVGMLLPRAAEAQPMPAREAVVRPERPRNEVLELPLVVVSPDRSVEVPLAQEPTPSRPSSERPSAQQPARPTVPPPLKRPSSDSTRKLMVPPPPPKVATDSLPRKENVDSIPRKGSSDSTLKPVAFAPGGSPTPRYPDILLSAGVSGDVIVQVVVDSSGLPIPSTIKVVRKSHDLFEASFRAVFSEIRFTPATLGDRRVRQLIQLVYRFDFEGATPRVVPPMSANLATFVIDVLAKPR